MVDLCFYRKGLLSHQHVLYFRLEEMYVFSLLPSIDVICSVISSRHRLRGFLHAFWCPSLLSCLRFKVWTNKDHLLTCATSIVFIIFKRLILFGTNCMQDITRCFLWVQQQKRMWPLPDTDPLHDPLDFQTISKLKETHCILSVSHDLQCIPLSSELRRWNIYWN
jgi:hypothetical protein